MKDEHFQSIMKPDWYCRYKCGADAKRICGGRGHGIGHHKQRLKPDAKAKQDIFDQWKLNNPQHVNQRRNFGATRSGIVKKDAEIEELSGPGYCGPCTGAETDDTMAGETDYEDEEFDEMGDSCGTWPAELRHEDLNPSVDPEGNMDARTYFA